MENINPTFGPFKALDIPHKEIVPTPQFRNIYPGNNTTMEPIGDGVYKINSTGGSGSGLQVITSEKEPQDLKAGDYWFQANSQSNQ